MTSGTASTVSRVSPAPAAADGKTQTPLRSRLRRSGWGRSGRRGNDPRLFLFLLPAAAVYLWLVLWPTVQAFRYSVTDWDGLSATFNEVGLNNYQRLLGGDSVFTQAVGNSFKFMFAVVLGQTTLSLILAIALQRNTRTNIVLRALYFFPTVLSSVSVAFIWTFVYDPTFGLANTFLAAIGLESWQQPWLGNQSMAIFYLAIVQIWFHAGQMMVVYIAGLHTIPLELYEAGDIDGTSRWQRFRYLTWPLIAPATGIVVAYTTIQSVQGVRSDLRQHRRRTQPCHRNPVDADLQLGLPNLRVRLRRSAIGDLRARGGVGHRVAAQGRRALLERGVTMAAPTLRGAGRTVLLTIYSLIILVPLTVVLFTTVKTSPQMYASPFGLPTSPTLDNFGELLRGGRLGASLFNSVVVTLSSVALTLLISSLAAFAIARIHGWLGIAVFGLFALGLAVPAQVAMIPQYVIFKQIGLTNSLLGLILINIAVTCPVAIFILTGFLKTLPTELFEAAEIDGAGQWRTSSIDCPAARRPIGGGGGHLPVRDALERSFCIRCCSSPIRRRRPCPRHCSTSRASTRRTIRCCSPAY